MSWEFDGVELLGEQSFRNCCTTRRKKIPREEKNVWRFFLIYSGANWLFNNNWIIFVECSLIYRILRFLKPNDYICNALSSCRKCIRTRNRKGVKLAKSLALAVRERDRETRRERVHSEYIARIMMQGRKSLNLTRLRL